MSTGALVADGSAHSAGIGLKRWLVSRIVTPTRIRKAAARLISWLMYRAMLLGAWSTISSFSKWMRRLADFMDLWNETELPEDKDRLITELVKDAVTDEAVDKLVDTISGAVDI